MQNFTIKRGNETISLTKEEIEKFSKALKDTEAISNSLNVIANFYPRQFSEEHLTTLKSDNELLIAMDEEIFSAIYSNCGNIEYETLCSFLEKVKDRKQI